VGLSGGKDSWALLQVLEVLRRRAPITFSLVAVTVDSGYDATGMRPSPQPVRAGWAHRVVHTRIGETIDEILEPGATPCSLCGAFRRGVLHRVADEAGATRRSRSPPPDDFVETLLLTSLRRHAQACRRLRIGRRTSRGHPAAGLRDEAEARAYTRRAPCRSWAAAAGRAETSASSASA